MAVIRIPEKRSSVEFAKAIRGHALRMVHHANASHIGSCLSCADIMAVLYNDVLNVDATQPQWPGRDRFILSKGHAAAIVYAALAERGFFPVEWLSEYCDDGCLLTGHVSHKAPGVEVSTGSLGHGLPIGCGIALHAMKTGNHRVFVLLGDGEMDEGSNWEAVLFAAHHRLSNLTAIVDHNGLQGFGRVSEVMELAPLADKCAHSGWLVQEIDGHDHKAIADALTRTDINTGKPRMIIARTVKGKGTSYMEDQLAWHYRSPNDELLSAALAELEASE